MRSSMPSAFPAAGKNRVCNVMCADGGFLLCENRYKKEVSMMEQTPLAMRKHIAIFGSTNAGKSTLFNALLGQDLAIVSEVSGTTTDPVTKAMELIPYGPVALIDTAGLGDTTVLGKQRMEKTLSILGRTDLILYVIDASDEAEGQDSDASDLKETPCLYVYTKCDLAGEERLQKIKTQRPEAVFLSNTDTKSLDSLKECIMEELEKQEREDETQLGGILPKGSTVVMVAPIDAEAPKGRLILPQVQLIRDCLDHDMKAYVTKETTLKDALENLRHVDLVVTDSQAFRVVDQIVPKEIPLTSFSMLLARQKGNFEQFLRGAEQIKQLRDGSRVLMLEGCTHNSSHEDIGRVKLPKLIEKMTGTKPAFEHFTGYSFPKEVEEYDLVIQCGMCMINKKEVRSRLRILAGAGVPVTNYGIALAYLNGILDRAKQILV